MTENCQQKKKTTRNSNQSLPRDQESNKHHIMLSAEREAFDSKPFETRIWLQEMMAKDSTAISMKLPPAEELSPGADGQWKCWRWFN